MRHDPDPDDGSTLPHGELHRIATCTRRRRVIEIHRAEPKVLSVRPLALVLKAGEWYLVHQEREPVVLGLRGLRSTRITKKPFEPPGDFDLAHFWRSWLDAR